LRLSLPSSYSGRKILAPAIVLVVLSLVLAATALAAKKKKDEETQTLQLPKELPAAVAGDTRRLSFLVTPLSARGLLSQQVRDALKYLEHQAAGNPVIAMRAFVAGSGDLRRVRELVSETFTEKHLPLPALSLIQAGALPLSGAQVVIEAVVDGRRDLYPGGLAFFAAAPFYADDPSAPAAPLLDRSLSGLEAALQAARLAGSDVLRVTCFSSTLENLEPARERVTAEYPRAAQNYLQTERAPQRAVTACEATAAIRDAGAPARLEFRTVSGANDGSRAALVGTPHIVFTGTQVSFGPEERDARLAFDRLGKTLEPLGVSLDDVALARIYPLSRRMEEQVRRLLPVLFNPQLPVVSLLEFEGLSSADAGFAVDAVAAKE
jgi:enamine deaminase RidA (YjgF/YER057c/UK114 family)